jgi:hypothetical protein
VLLFGALASLTGAVVAMARSSHSPPPPPPVAALPSRPATVRVNFNSDPDGASIVTGDGKTLGLTPLSIEVPYSDSAVEYRFRKQGYEQKTMYIVPNLPSPLFATMQAADVKAPPALAPAAAPAPAPRKSSSSSPSSSPSRHAKPSTPAPNGKSRPDDDEVLEPSYR